MPIRHPRKHAFPALVAGLFLGFGPSPAFGVPGEPGSPERTRHCANEFIECVIDVQEACHKKHHTEAAYQECWFDGQRDCGTIMGACNRLPISGPRMQHPLKPGAGEISETPPHPDPRPRAKPRGGLKLR